MWRLSLLPPIYLRRFGNRDGRNIRPYRRNVDLQIDVRRHTWIHWKLNFNWSEESGRWEDGVCWMGEKTNLLRWEHPWDDRESDGRHNFGWTSLRRAKFSKSMRPAPAWWPDYLRISLSDTFFFFWISLVHWLVTTRSATRNTIS